MYLTRKFSFSAAVQYGPDAKLHGHNYNCEVTVRGKVDPDTGVVIHLTKFGEKLNEAVRQELDQTFLNQLEYFKKLTPTPENIAVYAWEKLEKALPGLELYRIRVEESPESAVEYYGRNGK